MKRFCLRRVIPALTALSLLVSLSGCASALQALLPERENPPESSASSLPEGGAAASWLRRMLTRKGTADAVPLFSPRG